MKANPQAFFNKIYLTGGSANLLGLKDFMKTTLNSEVELLDPFENITLNENLDNLHLMAKSLVEYETLDSNQIDDIIAGVEPREPGSDSTETKAGGKKDTSVGDAAEQN